MRWRVIVLAVILLLGFLSFIHIDTQVNQSQVSTELRDYTPHDVIRINNNTDFADQAQKEGWPGSGTEDDPYIISGYDIDAHGAGVALYIGNTTVHFVVENCYLHNASYRSRPYFNGDGLLLYNVENARIVDNYFVNNEINGILVRYGKNNTIINNTVENNGAKGISLSYSTYNKVYGNKMKNDGIYLYGDFDTFTTQDIPKNNTVNGKPIFYYKNVNMNNASVPLEAGQVLLGNVSWLKIENLELNNTDVGIEIGFSTHIYVANNTIHDNNNDGIYDYYGSDFSTYVNNTIFNNSLSGLSLHSDNNYVKGNKIFNNTQNGIYLYYADRNLIVGNTVYGNGLYGARVLSSWDNHIYGNFFKYNHGSGDTYSAYHVQGYDDRNNYWNSSSGIGNYWHDWANNNDTNDQNGDGIVDWVYKMDDWGDVQDHYPLKITSINNVLSHPMNLTYGAGDGFVNLSWEAPVYGNETVIKYRIYRNGTLIATVPAEQLWYNDTDVENGETYTYYVTAINSTAESTKSNEVQATPGAVVPEFNLYLLSTLLLVVFLAILRRGRK